MKFAKLGSIFTGFVFTVAVVVSAPASAQTVAPKDKQGGICSIKDLNGSAVLCCGNICAAI